MLLAQRPKKSAFKIKMEIEIVNNSWLKYCDKYSRIHKLSKWPDREMFNKSIKIYFQDNDVCNKVDYISIFG